MKGETWVEIIKEKHILCEALSFVFPNTIECETRREVVFNRKEIILVKRHIDK